MTIKFSFNEKPIEVFHVTKPFHTYLIDYPCSSSVSCSPYTALLPRGQYIFELWGGAGGFNGGRGGYSRGTLTINAKTNIYIFIGSQGVEKNFEAGLSTEVFNGGGKCFSAHSTTGTDTSRSCGSGGGSSDIRIGGSSINHRIIVAGGGGGGSFSLNTICRGGNGGGTSGYDGTCFSDYGLGGSQTSGGLGYYQGSFGYGGNSTSGGTSGGGGGGWYGGGAALSGSGASGGGGSGYVLTESSQKPSEYIYDEKYFLHDSIILSGSQIFDKCGSPGIQLNETGHSGNGCARITKLDQNNVCICSYLTNRMANIFTFTVTLEVFLAHS